MILDVFKCSKKILNQKSPQTRMNTEVCLSRDFRVRLKPLSPTLSLRCFIMAFLLPYHPIVMSYYSLLSERICYQIRKFFFQSLIDLGAVFTLLFHLLDGLICLKQR